MNFAKVPLTPSRSTNFAPTPIKKIDFSAVRAKTPGKKLGGLKFLHTPAKTHETIPSSPSDVCHIGKTQATSEKGDELQEQLDLDIGVLRIEDGFVSIVREELEPIEDQVGNEDEEDVEGILEFSPTPSIPAALPAIDPYTTPSSPHSPCVLASPATPILVDSDEESNGSVIWNPTPRRTPGKRIVLSDSDSDAETGPSSSSAPQRVSHSDSLSPIRDRALPKIRRKPAILRFIEDQAHDKSDEQELYDEEDDTLGSLRDFIVDDDYETEEEEISNSEEEDYGSDEGQRSEGDESDGIEILPTPPKAKTANTPKSHFDDEILYYSPPGRVHRLDIQLPDLDQLVIASSDSEAASHSPIRNKKKSISREKSEKKSFTSKGWAEERERIANVIFKELDERVFERKLGIEGVGAKVIWNKRLLTTAGVARSKRVTKNGESTKEHWIELSEKVLTGEKQIINTVAHEMCHLATWIISNEYRNPHGRIFKSWGKKVMRVRKDIEVTTTHAYTIEYKYHWKCSTNYCGKVDIQNATIDTTKHACGSCKGKLVPLFETKQKASSAFQVYLKTNMKNAKNAMPGSSHGEVMRALSKRWNEFGENGNHEDFWKSAAAASVIM
uniref:SprT-like domain-containing protein n=1 Tax=Kwoniella pini CBS 10737 TaxID=1296096 RepID=A0A1B9I4Q7_9TREE|nr:uncharacterized protein I206_03833 [Kwoniella pini CBS 10737]OCF50509.1 hypothetical protein I206_03833 [Kwoniella pini CBS 10737]